MFLSDRLVSIHLRHSRIFSDCDASAKISTSKGYAISRITQERIILPMQDHIHKLQSHIMRWDEVCNRECGGGMTCKTANVEVDEV